MSRTTPLARPIAVLRRIGRTRLAAIAVVGRDRPRQHPPSSSGPRTPASDAAVDAWLDAEIGDAGYPGASIAVIRDGQVEHVHVIGTADSAGRPVTTDTPFVIGSLSKSLTALAIMRLVDAGRVELDAPVATYLAGLPDRRRRRRADHDPRAPRAHERPVTGGGRPVEPAHDPDRVRPRLAASRRSPRPARPMPTPTSTTSCSGAVIEAVTGQPYPDAMQALVFDPLAMRPHDGGSRNRPGARSRRCAPDVVRARVGAHAALPRGPRAGRLHRLDRRRHGPPDRDAPRRRRLRRAPVPQRGERRCA